MTSIRVEPMMEAETRDKCDPILPEIPAPHLPTHRSSLLMRHRQN